MNEGQQQNYITTENMTAPTENLLDYLTNKVSSIQSSATNTSTATVLMRQYMNMEYQFINSDPVQLWKTYSDVLNPLSEVAFKYASIPATSVPSKRIFSKAGQIVSQRRNRLLPDNVN